MAQRLFVTVIERDTEDPLVVGAWRTLEDARAWVDGVNDLTNEVWSDDPGWFNYAREPVPVLFPDEFQSKHLLPEVARALKGDAA